MSLAEHTISIAILCSADGIIQHILHNNMGGRQQIGLDSRFRCCLIVAVSGNRWIF